MKALFLTLIVLTAASALRADEIETVTLTGRVVDSRIIVHRKVRTALFYLRLKVEVDRVESGRELLRGTKIIDLRCWHENDSAGRSLGGHQPIPADGTTFSAVLRRDPEGFFEPVANDAIVLADAAGARTFPIMTKAPSTTGMVVGGIAGLIAFVCAVFIRYLGRGPRDRSWSAAEEKNEE